MRLSIFLCTLLLASSAQAFALQGSGRLSTLIALKQPGSPVDIISSTATQTFFFDRITIRNNTTKNLWGLRFGVDLYEARGQGGKPEVYKNREVPVDIGPGETSTLNVGLVRTSRLKSDFSAPSCRAALVIGILSAEFSDGTAWTFDHKKYGAFMPDFRPKTGNQSTSGCKNGPALGDAPNIVVHYTCASTGTLEYCKNQDTSCTVSGCSSGTSCAQQACAPL